MFKTESLKALLDSLIAEGERDFEIVYSRLRPARRRGLYDGTRKIITLYPRCYEDGKDLIASALHELSHHLHWARRKDSLLSLWHQGERIPHHGADFKEILHELTSAFNLRYQGRLKGFLTYDRRKPKVPPRFRSLIATVPFPYGEIAMSKRKPQLVFLIGFEGKKALAYSKGTHSYDTEVPKGLVKRLCRHAAIKPKSGELWEFRIVAKRIVKRR